MFCEEPDTIDQNCFYKSFNVNNYCNSTLLLKTAEIIFMNIVFADTADAILFRFDIYRVCGTIECT